MLARARHDNDDRKRIGRWSSTAVEKYPALERTNTVSMAKKNNWGGWRTLNKEEHRYRRGRQGGGAQEGETGGGEMEQEKENGER